MRCRACGQVVDHRDEYCQRCGCRLPDRGDDGVGSDSDGRSAGVRRLQRGSNAADEEVELWTGRFSWKGLFKEILMAVLVTVGLVWFALQSGDNQLTVMILPLVATIWVLLAVWLAYRKLDVRYTLTNQKLIHEEGILIRRTSRIETIDIDDLSFEQGILERLVDVGRIRIYASDASNRSLTLLGINQPRRVYELMERSRRDERLRYGLHVEAI